MDEETKQELLEIVEHVSDLEKQRVEIDSQINELILRRLHIIYQVEVRVFLETDERGKQRYPNEQSRKAASALHLGEIEEYQNLDVQIRKLRAGDKILAIECVRLKARYQVLIAFSTEGGQRLPFPSIQFEDLDLLAAGANLPEKIRRLVSQSQQETITNVQLSEDAKNELLQIRTQVTELDKREVELSSKRYDISKHIHAKQNDALLEATAERDTKEKPVYPTDKTREAASRSKLQKSQEYQELLNGLHEIELELRELEDVKGKLMVREENILSGNVVVDGMNTRVHGKPIGK